MSRAVRVRLPSLTPRIGRPTVGHLTEDQITAVRPRPYSSDLTEVERREKHDYLSLAFDAFLPIVFGSRSVVIESLLKRGDVGLEDEPSGPLGTVSNTDRS